MIAALSGCGEDAKDCGGFWDKTFGREECAVATSNPVPTNNNVVAPKISNVSPMQATVGTTTTFTITGENLTDMVQVALPDCDALTVTARNSTQITFSCKPLSISSQKLVVSNGSTELFSSNVNFTVDKSDPSILKGVFVDSFVGGLDFETDSIKGLTDGNGTFYYRAGEKINFKIGNQEIGKSIGQSNIHVYDLEGDLADIKYEKARKIAQLLQSLDSDGNPLNNIIIDPAVREHFLKEENLISYYVTDEVYEQALENQLKALRKTVVSAQQAEQHLQSTINKPLYEYPAFIGSVANVQSGFPSINNGHLSASSPIVNLPVTIGSDYYAVQYYYIYQAKVAPLIKREIKRAFEGIDVAIEAGQEQAINDNKILKTIEKSFSTTVDYIDGYANLLKVENAANNKEAIALYLKASNVILKPLVGLVDVFASYKDDGVESKLDTAKVLLDFVGQNAECILGAKTDDKKIEKCAEAIARSIELTGHTKLYQELGFLGVEADKDKQKRFKDVLKVIATTLEDTVGLVSERSWSAAFKLAGSAIGVGVELTKTNQDSEGKQFFYDTWLNGAIMPALKATDCINVKLNFADQFADCMNDVVFPQLKTAFKIGYRFAATLDIQKNLQAVYEYDVANMMLHDVFIYNGVYEPARYLAIKWGYPDPSKSGFLSDEEYIKKVIKILLTDKQKSKSIWSRGFDVVTLSPSNSSDAVDNAYRIYKNYLNTVIAMSKDYSKSAFQVSLNLVDNPNGLDINATVNFNYNISDVDGGSLRCFIDDKTQSLQTQSFEIRPTNLKRDIPFVLKPSKAGLYDVVCDARSESGFLGRTRGSVAVSDTTYSIKWGKDKSVVRVGEPISFDVTGNGKTMLVKWQFGDDAKSYIASPMEDISYTFTHSGKQTIKATAIDIFGRVFEYAEDVDVITGTIVSTPTNPTAQDEVTFSVSTAIDYVKSVVWSIGETVVQTLNSIAEVFKHIFNTVGDVLVSATLKDSAGAEITTVSTTVNVKPLVCLEGQVEQGGKCVDKPSTVVFEDNFNDTTNGVTVGNWTAIVEGTNPSVQEANQRLEVTLPANSVDSAKQVFEAGYQNTCQLEGDFDVQVDYDLLDFPVYNGVRVGLTVGDRARQASTLYTITRISQSGHEGDLSAREGVGVNFTNTFGSVDVMGNTTGTLRLARIGNTIYGYRYDNNGWQLLDSNTITTNALPVTISAWSHNGRFDNKNIKVAFDNFKVTKGTLVGDSCKANGSMTGSFTVPANSETGVAFTSPSSTKPLQCSFTASGEWKWDVPSAATTAAGIGLNATHQWLMPSVSAMSLIANTGDKYEYIGTSKTMSVAVGQSLHFMMNDGLSFFSDNTGELTVTYTCSEMPQLTGLLNDTGISQCSNENSWFTDCSSATLGKWFGLNQDAQVGRDALAVKGQLSKTGAGDAGFDFTKISTTGQKLPANATSWDCVLDNHTGLMWEVKTDDGGLRDKDNTYIWYNLNINGGNAGSENNTQAFAQAVNAQGLCGHGDWRLPNKQELHSIVNYGKYNPAIDSTYFANTQSSWYWSSSPHVENSGSVCIVGFDYGGIGGQDNNNNGYVRLVRASQ